MTSYLIDLNVWLAMTWDLHPQHRPASHWFGALSRRGEDVELMFCRFTMIGFLRLLTNRSVMGDSIVTLGQALDIYDRWHRDPRVVLAPEPRGVDGILRDAAEPLLSKPATKAVADCYLAAFAKAAGAHLVTIDKALAGTARSLKNQAVLIASD